MNWETIEIRKCDQGYVVTVRDVGPSYWIYVEGGYCSNDLTTTAYAVETGEGVVELLRGLLEEENDPET